MHKKTAGNLPRHIAIIMDGNGRWAQERKRRRIFGHRKGVEIVRNVVEVCRKIDVEYLTLYAFSTENWLRPKTEVSALMELLLSFLKTEVKEMAKNDIRFNAIGNLARLPESARAEINDALALTAHCRSLVLTIALSYGGREEMLNTIKNIIISDRANPIDIEKIDDAFFSSLLYTASIPDPDLLIRTGREKRISNFLLWQAAYTELYFTDVLWPDFGEEELWKAIEDYKNRKRRFGKVDEA